MAGGPWVGWRWMRGLSLLLIASSSIAQESVKKLKMKTQEQPPLDRPGGRASFLSLSAPWLCARRLLLR